jgi:hypothetical protein
MEKVLFHTDIGSDIDDAVALAFADTPLLVEPHQPRAPQAARLERWKHHDDGPHEVGIDVNADRFFATYFEVF